MEGTKQTIVRSIHFLKCWPEQFDAIVEGAKTFDVRINDRPFALGDVVVMLGYYPNEKYYSNRSVPKIITYILDGGQFGVKEGYCVLGLGVMHISFELQTIIERELIALKHNIPDVVVHSGLIIDKGG